MKTRQSTGRDFPAAYLQKLSCRNVCIAVVCLLIASYSSPSTAQPAIIVGTGSFLSHAGTVARELHVPCIVDVAECTTRFKTGQRLIVDASHCTIEVGSDAEDEQASPEAEND